MLAFDSGALPVIMLTKSDLVDDVSASVESLEAVAAGVPVMLASGISGDGVDAVRDLVRDHSTMAMLGASGVGKSTLINALTGSRDACAPPRCARAISVGGTRPPASRWWLCRPPTASVQGWLIDTPGVRAVSLWSSGRGIEWAFVDVFDLAEHCRFRDCKHEDEPGCAVLAAIADGRLDPRRLDALKRLVAEEAALEDEQLRPRAGARPPRRRKPALPRPRRVVRQAVGGSRVAGLEHARVQQHGGDQPSALIGSVVRVQYDSVLRL